MLSNDTSLIELDAVYGYLTYGVGLRMWLKVDRPCDPKSRTIAKSPYLSDRDKQLKRMDNLLFYINTIPSSRKDRYRDRQNVGERTTKVNIYQQSVPAVGGGWCVLVCITTVAKANKNQASNE